MYNSKILSELYSFSDEINNIKYCDYLIEYPVPDIINLDWKTILPDFPKNNSQITYNEILDIKKKISSRTSSDIELILNIDDDANFLVKQTVKRYDLKFPDSLFNELYSIIKPIIYNTKYYFNRPRPYQIDKFFNTNIEYIATGTHHTPSYPSGHTVYTCLACLILTKLYPQLRYEFEKLTRITSDCRILQGVHFQSDNDASILLTKSIFNNVYSNFIR